MSSADPVSPAFVKGHGTENDFVLLPDPDGVLELTAELARRLCDRRTGIGADGAIRVANGPSGRFLMDYRNSDGSPAQMCGNGARVFARFLVDAGWAAPGHLEFETAGGVRTADLGPAGDVRIGMGRVRIGDVSVAVVGGRQISGRASDVGNPHLVCLIDDDLAGLDLREPPGYDEAVFPEGVNIEFVRQVGSDAVTMRVYERGAGETRSCGTGTVAAAAVHLADQERDSGTVGVSVPGGLVSVQIHQGTADLIGPAVLVYSGTLNPSVISG